MGQNTIVDDTLHFRDFLNQVEQHHPLAVIARSETDLAQQYLRAARGGFDPQISGEVNSKQYSTIDYYTTRSAALEIPTWMGVKVLAGWDQNEGQYLNPQYNVPDGGLVHAGVSLELGAGLLMDNRRAALRQAEIGLELGDLERQLQLNKLYVEATKAYFSWTLADQLLKISEEAVRLAQTRYDGVVESFVFGDIPAIDTVEAYSQVLSRLYTYRENQTKWVQALNTASAYLWNENGQTTEISPETVPLLPENAGEESTRIQGLMISESHPLLLQLSAQRDITGIEQRLAAEYLRPEIALNYNFLTRDLAQNQVEDYFTDSRFFSNNYTFGASIRFPIFLREARGRVGATTVKMKMIDNEYINRRARLTADFRAATNERSNLIEQIDFYAQNVALQRQLLEGEQELFFNGESSLFLVNARETSLLNAQQIYYNLQAKLVVLEAEIRALAGEGF